MDKNLSIWKHGTPEQLRRLARTYQKAALMEDLDSGEKEGLFLKAKGALWVARNKEQHARDAAQHERRRSAMPVSKKMKQLPENDRLVNQAALRWLNLANVVPDHYHLHLLTLARWGLKNRAEGDWPEDLGDAVEIQLEDMASWNSENLMKWLFANQDEGEPQEQEPELLLLLKKANGPVQAAEMVLCTIWLMMLQEAA
jgi:hypothetical protein